jgi:hypothetical protein
MASTSTGKASFETHANGTATNPPASPGTQPSGLSSANLVGTTPKEVYDHYSRLQLQLQLDFQRDLAKAAGLNVSQAASTGFDTGLHTDATGDKVLANANAGTRKQMTIEAFIADDESSDGSSDDSSAMATSRNAASATDGIANGKKLQRQVGDAVLNGNGAATGAAALTAGRNGARSRKVEQPLQRYPAVRDGRTSHKKRRRGTTGGRKDGGPMNGGFFLGGLKPMDMDLDNENTHETLRVRASKLEYKRLDHLYNKNIHDFYLTESTKSPGDKSDKWEEYIFVVRRRFGMY